MTIATLDGVSLANATAPILFQTCKFPIMDLRRYRTPDEVVRNMPVYIGNWGAGTIAPALDSQVINIDTVTNVADACRFPIVTVTLGGCSWIAPDQKVLGVESESINWAALVTAYCTNANIALDRIGQIFNADGTLNTGNPYTLNIVRFATAALIEALGLQFTHSAMLGDYSYVNQFDGLYPQIDYGWTNGSDACSSALNTGNEINWDTLTGGDGTGTASPDAETEATTITLWGNSFSVPAGWTLGDFLAAYAEAAQANYGRGQEIAWEMHAPSGWRMSVLKALSCVQLCNYTMYGTDSLVERYSRLINAKIAELFGYGLTFPIFETAYAGANTLRFGPREVGGLPTYGLVFENIVNVLRALNPIGTALYGSGAGRLPGGEEPLIGMTRDKIANRFEASTLHWDFTKLSAICVRASMMLKAGLLATERHLWLKVTNVGVTSFRLSAPDDLTVDGVALNNAPPAAPTLSSPADDATTTDTTPTLSWVAITGVESYDVQIATDSAFATIVAEDSVTTNSFTPDALPDNDEYFWRVRARDLDGIGAWSVTRSFTVDTTP